MTTTPTPNDAANVPATKPINDTQVAKFLAEAQGAIDGGGIDADAVSFDIMQRILSAETMEDILGGNAATHAKDVLGETLLLRDMRFNKSDFDAAGVAVYALLDCVNSSGEAVTIAAGARNVIAQAWALKDKGFLPASVVIRESERATANGYRVQYLEAAPKPF